MKKKNKGPLTASEIARLRRVREKWIKKGVIPDGKFMDPEPCVVSKYFNSPNEKSEGVTANADMRNSSGKDWRELDVGEDNPPPWEINSDYRRFKN